MLSFGWRHENSVQYCSGRQSHHLHANDNRIPYCHTRLCSDRSHPRDSLRRIRSPWASQSYWWLSTKIGHLLKCRKITFKSHKLQKDSFRCTWNVQPKRSEKNYLPSRQSHRKNTFERQLIWFSLNRESRVQVLSCYRAFQSSSLCLVHLWNHWKTQGNCKRSWWNYCATKTFDESCIQWSTRVKYVLFFWHWMGFGPLIYHLRPGN